MIGRQTAAETAAELTRLRDQIGDVKAHVHQLYVDAEPGGRLEAALESAEALLSSANANLGRARDALTKDAQATKEAMVRALRTGDVDAQVAIIRQAQKIAPETELERRARDGDR